MEHIRKAPGIKHCLIESEHNRTVPTYFLFNVYTVFFYIETCRLVALHLSDFGVSLRHKTGLSSSALFGSLVHFRSPSLAGLVRPSAGKKNPGTIVVFLSWQMGGNPVMP